MVWVPGGTFIMGSDAHYPEEAPAHRVVEGEDRLGELSRMMGGGDTEVGLTHARELLEQCRGTVSTSS